MEMKTKYRIDPRPDDPQVTFQIPQGLYSAIVERARFKHRTVVTEMLDIVRHVLGYHIAFHPEFITVGSRVVHIGELFFANDHAKNSWND